MLIFIVDLDVLHAGELPHGLRERLRDVIRGPVRPAVAGEVDVQCAVGELNAPVADKPIGFGNQALRLLLRRGSVEILIEGRRDWIG